MDGSCISSLQMETICNEEYRLFFHVYYMRFCGKISDEMLIACTVLLTDRIR